MTLKEIYGTRVKYKGVFSGEIDLSEGASVFYDDYSSGSSIDLSVSPVKVLGSIATVRIKGDLTGSIPSTWNLSGQPITNNAGKSNELTILYVSDNDIRIVNRVVDYVDTESPSVPTNLSGSATSSTNVTIKWTASTDNVSVVGYKIYQDGAYIGTTTGTTFIVSGLSAQTSYNFSVSAFDGSQNESSQTGITVTTGSASYETEYQTMLNYASANGFDLPSDAQKAIDNQKIINLKSQGIWDELDVLYVAKATYSPSSFESNFYRLNWKNPGTFTLTSVGGTPSWISGSGFYVTGGSGIYMKTGFIPSTSAVKFTAANNSAFFKLFNLPTVFSSATYFFGGRTTNDPDQILFGNNVDNGMLLRLINDGVETPGFFPITQSNINAHYHILTNDPNIVLYINGVSIATKTNKVGALTTVEQYMMAYNENGTAVEASQNTGITYLALGSNLEVKQSAIYNIMNETY